VIHELAYGWDAKNHWKLSLILEKFTGGHTHSWLLKTKNGYWSMGRNNLLSRTTHGRIERYLLPNGIKDPIYNIADSWSDYARYFYPEGGDYTKTKRWKFIDDLVSKDLNTK
jgi:hypothetical protein